jgi:hypothetical protein
MRGIVHTFRITKVEREAVCGDGGVEGRVGHGESHRLVSGRVNNLIASARHTGAVVFLLAIGEQNHHDTNQQQSVEFFDVIHNQTVKIFGSKNTTFSVNKYWELLLAISRWPLAFGI